MKRIHIELGIVICFFTIATLFLNPFNIWMYPGVQSLLLVSFVVFAIAFVLLVVGEPEGDEREEAHRVFAGQTAFVAGTLVLLTGIVVETLSASLDPWLIYGLCAMIVAKVGARVYCAYRN